jgi:hypothetical protein
MKLIKTSDKLPELKKGQKQKIHKKELLRLAERVGEILRKEKAIDSECDENIPFSGHAFNY